MQGHHLGDFSRRPIRLYGSFEIRRFHTSWGWYFIPLFTGFLSHPRWLFGISEPSTVWPCFRPRHPSSSSSSMWPRSSLSSTIIKVATKNPHQPPLIPPPPVHHIEISLDKHTQAIPSQCSPILNSQWLRPIPVTDHALIIHQSNVQPALAPHPPTPANCVPRNNWPYPPNVKKRPKLFHLRRKRQIEFVVSSLISGCLCLCSL